GHSKDRPFRPPDARCKRDLFSPEGQRGPDHGQFAGWPDALYTRQPRGAGERIRGAFSWPSTPRVIGSQSEGNLFAEFILRRAYARCLSAWSSDRFARDRGAEREAYPDLTRFHS